MGVVLLLSAQSVVTRLSCLMMRLHLSSYNNSRIERVDEKDRGGHVWVFVVD